jgi:hypothetical protein
VNGDGNPRRHCEHSEHSVKQLNVWPMLILLVVVVLIIIWLRPH